MAFYICPEVSRRGWLWSKQLRFMRERWQDGEETALITSRVTWFFGEYVERGKELLDMVLSIMEKE